MVVFAWRAFVHCSRVDGLASVLKFDGIATVVHQSLGQSNDEITGFRCVTTACWSVQVCSVVKGWDRSERAGGEEGGKQKINWHIQSQRSKSQNKEKSPSTNQSSRLVALTQRTSLDTVTVGSGTLL